MKQLIKFRFLGCFVVLYVLFALAFYFFPSFLIDKSLPVLTLPISLIHPNFKMQTGMDGSKAIYLQGLTIEEQYVGSQKQTFRRPFRIAQDRGIIFGMPLVFFSLLFSWPGIPIRYRLKAAALAFPVLILMVMMDLSLTLLLEMEIRLTGGTLWNKFLYYLGAGFNAGGRQILGLLLFGAALAPRLLKKPIYPTTLSLGRNSPCPCGSGKKYKNCCMR
jgi:hypothetical protein